ncbi:hypothetical protein HDV00_004631 [Rhizophlyctis rosea]|nr:hypothetical protein HDV00_004631 [Rhizophlyctis rosea]
MTHRHPESHSTKCTEKKRSTTHSSYKADAKLMLETAKRDPSAANKPGSVAKEREDARKRLKEKMEAARKAEGRGVDKKGK